MDPYVPLGVGSVSQGVSSRVGGEAMKLILSTIFAGVVVTAIPALAAPQWVETACRKAANRVLPALDFREREAYVANCIADWTAGTPPPQGRKSYDRNRY
jgi:phosphoribosylformimino-5-aminoimidazole carboxamide ribonucleotide (ProFAR) isomerase